MQKLTLPEWLDLIKFHGSITAAAKSQGISRQALSRRFTSLPDNSPIKLKYKELAQKTKRGTKRVYDSKRTANRLKMRRYRERKKRYAPCTEKASDENPAQFS